MKDTVERLTPMGVMVLALLREGDMHPYEMVRLMRTRHGSRLLTITNGTLYHSVSRLQQSELIEEVGVARAGNRPERTTYALTAAGSDALLEWVRQELPRVDRPERFRIAVVESHNLDATEVLALLRERRGALVSEQAAHQDRLATGRANGVPEQFLLDVERQAQLLAADLRWLDTLIERLYADAIPWGSAGFDDSDRYVAQRKAARQ
ncbi:PadR family transcriptional regulator [Microbacterium oryzae]|uniref:PadR family transcriptional regulator n=1 Tax=Microbacterium oryzae TaxID=743009 RepID=UPI0025B23F8B|nr:PadR family transcriptional regulator [Microbacterium oryzae]MDN3309804.1 PadR family transcriptional regulator [Microbacterium oryzae]